MPFLKDTELVPLGAFVMLCNFCRTRVLIDPRFEKVFIDVITDKHTPDKGDELVAEFSFQMKHSHLLRHSCTTAEIRW
jgi:hypothetical protein